MTQRNIIEEHNGVERWGDTWYARAFDKLNNWLAADVTTLRMWGWAWDAEGPWVVRDTPERTSQFWNGYVMARLVWSPERGLGWGLHLKPWRNRRIQGAAGIKVNGRYVIGPTVVLLPLLISYGSLGWWWLLAAPLLPLLTMAWRVQSDASAKQGYHPSAPNLGHAEDWERGTA